MGVVPWEKRPSDTTRNCLKLCQGRFTLYTRKYYVIKRIVKKWNRLLRKVVESPPLAVFKRGVDMALMHTV